MIGAASELFDRQFAPGDEALFSQLVAGLLGQECIAWRKSYGGTGSLHFGQLIPRRAPPSKAVDKDRGSWVLWLWACNQRLALPSGEQLDSTQANEEAVLAKVPQLVGTKSAEHSNQSGDSFAHARAIDRRHTRIDYGSYITSDAHFFRAFKTTAPSYSRPNRPPSRSAEPERWCSSSAQAVG